MEPIADYEQTGFFGNVVFTNGHLVDGDTVIIYYGAVGQRHLRCAIFHQRDSQIAGLIVMLFRSRASSL